MQLGFPNGRRDARGGTFGLFVDEEGYTTVASAVSLLVSLSLVFCLASAQWTLARAADVQEVADAAALAGSNAVAAFCTVAQVVDAGILSMGLLGMAIMGAGLVLSAIPGAGAVAGKVLDAGEKVLNARRRFAQSALSGLQRLERALPALVVMRSASCVLANQTESISYLGAALPFPLESRSDYSILATEVTGDDVRQASERLQDEAERARQAKERADEARERGWRADCVDAPSCLRSRAASLAGMGGAENPGTPTPEEWNFGMPIRRSRTYYSRRLAHEAPAGQDIESVTDSLARAKFYSYALGEANGAWYTEFPDGSVSVSIPHLARTADEVRGCWMYVDPAWPCTEEEAGRTLHSTLSCPGATGALSGSDSVRAVDVGSARLCDVCRMDVRDLGAVASISTIATNGYEHYWQQIVEAARDYQAARNEQADAESRMRDVAQQGKGVFDRALDQLRVPRPSICPPGAWGCVSVVRRGAGTVVPTELTAGFLSGAALPPGVAASASVLVADDASDGNDALSRFFEGIVDEGSMSVGGVLDGVAGLWGRLLVSYGSAYEGVGSAVGGFLDGVDGIFGGGVGAWLKGAVASSMEAMGLQPADMRMRKPVLTNTQNVLGRAGVDKEGKVRELVRALPAHGSPMEVARALGMWLWGEVEGGSMTIAELPIPGTDRSTTLSVDLSQMGGLP